MGGLSQLLPICKCLDFRPEPVCTFSAKRRSFGYISELSSVLYSLVQRSSDLSDISIGLNMLEFSERLSKFMLSIGNSVEYSDLCGFQSYLIVELLLSFRQRKLS